MSILVGPVEAAELSLLPAGLVFDQAWMHLSSDFHFHSFKRKGDFTIDPNVPMQMWLESRNVRLFENRKSAQKSNWSNLIEARIGPDSWEVFVGGLCLRSEGIFLIAFFSWLILFAQRGYFKKL